MNIFAYVRFHKKKSKIRDKFLSFAFFIISICEYEHDTFLYQSSSLYGFKTSDLFNWNAENRSTVNPISALLFSNAKMEKGRKNMTVRISYDEGKTIKNEEECVYDANITHNLNTMADKADIYKALWRPEEINIFKAKGLIELLEIGLKDLKNRPEYFKEFNSSNGWGMYAHFVPFVEKYLNACKEFPESDIHVSR
jgi:hypothetical protein